MLCNKCKKPLPSDGIICKFCGAMMTPEQVALSKQMNNKNKQKVELLSEKYGQEQKIEYREVKENKLLGAAIIIIVLLILITITILINV